MIASVLQPSVAQGIAVSQKYPSISGKVVLLTGSTGAMGRHLVDAFLHAGARLALCVRRMANLPDLELALANHIDDTAIIPCDLRYEENVVRLIHRVVHRFGQIDVVVNAASILGPREFVMNYPADPWRDVIATNATAPYLVCREALPWMKRQNSGAIINVTSSLTRDTKAKRGAYLVACHAVEGLTKLLACELKDTNIRVNSIDIGRMGDDVQPVASPQHWVPAFLWAASDDCRQSGERISITDFDPGGSVRI
ncbi:MAG TPA: SDR family oxidoreductase [Phycisphaerae bacterium]|nr:SDR family oxidoreductase [Phycisphaerae bacterium]HRW51362.1 SDR family oxidoreductase [Phycisphaerae bacterium]